MASSLIFLSSFLWPASAPGLLRTPTRSLHHDQPSKKKHSHTHTHTFKYEWKTEWEKVFQQQHWRHLNMLYLAWLGNQKCSSSLPLIHKHWAFPDSFPWASLSCVPTMCGISKPCTFVVKQKKIINNRRDLINKEIIIVKCFIFFCVAHTGTV